MVSIEKAKEMALSFEETDAHPHFERTAYRVKKKIFCTLLESDRSMNFKLTPFEQQAFCTINQPWIHPVPGGWGRQGMTTLHLQKVPVAFFRDVMTTAYCNVAPPALAEKYRLIE